MENLVNDESDLVIFQLEVPGLLNDADNQTNRMFLSNNLHCQGNRYEFVLMLTTSNNGFQVVLTAHCNTKAGKTVSYNVVLIAYKPGLTNKREKTR